MKVKGIESALSKGADRRDGFHCGRFLASSSNDGAGRFFSRSAARRYRLTLALSLLLLAAPYESNLTAARASGYALESQADKQDKQAARAYRAGKKAIRSGHYDQAVKAYHNILLLNWKDIQAHLGISYAYMKLQNYQLCYDHAKEALNIDPTNSRAHALVGVALLRSGYVKQSIGSLVEAVKSNPKEALAHGAAAEIDFYEGRSKEARLKAYYAHTLDSNEPDYIFTYARAASRLELYGEAADAYERFLMIAPKSDVERRERIKGLIKFYRYLAGVSVHQISGPRQEQIAFRLGQDRRPYMKVKVNGRDATFVIDTGSGFTVISKDAAKKFGVSELARGGSSQGFGGNGKFPIVYGLLSSLQMGDVKVKAVPCFIRPFHGGTDGSGELQADGLIGLSVLAYFLTELDYKDSVLRLDRDTDKQLPDATSPDVRVIPFRTTQNGLISIETQIDGAHSINAIMDSAASSSVISTAAVERLKMHDKIIKGQTVQVAGAAGIADNVELLFIRNCRIADIEQNNLRALVLDFGAINENSGFEQSGILGGDFLRHFKITIDFNRAQVLFKPHTLAKQ